MMKTTEADAVAAAWYGGDVKGDTYSRGSPAAGEVTVNEECVNNQASVSNRAGWTSEASMRLDHAQRT